MIHRGPRVWDERTYAPGGERLSAAVLAEGPISVPTVVQLHKETGRVMQAWGQGALYLPHSVVTDRDGNVWVTDTGLHQVHHHGYVQMQISHSAVHLYGSIKADGRSLGVRGVACAVGCKPLLSSWLLPMLTSASCPAGSEVQ